MKLALMYFDELLARGQIANDGEKALAALRAIPNRIERQTEGWGLAGLERRCASLFHGLAWQYQRPFREVRV